MTRFTNDLMVFEFSLLIPDIKQILILIIIKIKVEDRVLFSL